MNTPDKRGVGRTTLVTVTLAGVLLLVFYYLTCFRTFTWWDSSEYSVAALTMGIPHPPGSLVTVLIGRVVTLIPLGIDKFFALNLTASFMAALTATLVGYISLRLAGLTTDRDSIAASGKNIGLVIGITVGALFYGVSATSWYYAIRFTPYTTTVLLTALIVLAMLAWQRRSGDANSHIWLGLVTLLLGFDFSVHRTNLLLLPALFIWVLLFNPRAYSSLKCWLFGIIGFFAGLSFHLLTIPIAMTQPVLNANDPSNFARFWDYISLAQYGGGWLINIYPRKAAFISIQVADYFKIFSDNFANGYLPPLGYLPLLIGLAGIFMLFRRNWRLGLGFVVLFLCSSLGAIIYFNLPHNFFRSIDRHYMPSFVIFGIFVAYGAGGLLKASLGRGKRLRVIAAAACICLLALMPLQAILRNYRLLDGSKSFFAYHAAKNFLGNLPQNAILFTQADIDTYTLWDLQVAEGFRTDVTVCNMSLMNTPWFVRQVMQNDSDFPLRLDEKEIAALSVIPWKDSVITLPIRPTDGDTISSGAALPSEVILTVPSNLQGGYLLVQDQMVMKTLLANNWRRPICFSALLPESSVAWLKPNLRLEGLHWRLVPAKSDILDRELLRKNICDKYDYSGYADQAIIKDDPTKWLGWNFCGAFVYLAYLEQAAGDTLACKATIEHMQASLSPENLTPRQDLLDAIANACK